MPTLSGGRIRALVDKELLELWRNRSALLPVIAVALVSLVMPLFIGLAVPLLTGEGLSADGDLVESLAKAGEELPRAFALSDEGAVQAFLFNRFITLLLLVPVTGSITFAGHSLVGEKLGRSLEPLLATPITTFELLVAKSLGALVPSLLVMLATFGIYLAAIAAFAEPGVVGAMITGRTLLLALGVGPLASLVALQVGVLVSARVNDPRTAQQFGALLILPLTGLFLAQLTGVLILTVPLMLLMLLVLTAIWLLLVAIGVVVFDRETILTRWR
jgi:ABC-2 type transport system permease protein